MNDILLLQLENMTPIKWISADFERRLFQSMTVLINIGIKQLFTEVEVVILRFHYHFGK